MFCATPIALFLTPHCLRQPHSGNDEGSSQELLLCCGIVAVGLAAIGSQTYSNYATTQQQLLRTAFIISRMRLPEAVRSQEESNWGSTEHDLLPSTVYPLQHPMDECHLTHLFVGRF